MRFLSNDAERMMLKQGIWVISFNCFLFNNREYNLQVRIKLPYFVFVTDTEVNVAGLVECSSCFLED